MSEYLNWPILVTYCVFTFFAYKQKNYYLDFQGVSQGYHFLVGILAFFAMFFGVGFLIFYGIRTTWWTPLILVAAGLFTFGPLSLVERMTSIFISRAAWGLLSFAIIPICAALLVYFTPHS
jgi:hypothetical protein